MVLDLHIAELVPGFHVDSLGEDAMEHLNL